MKNKNRQTVYNRIVTREALAGINPENQRLLEDFKGYMVAMDYSGETIRGYENDLKIFFTYCENNMDNVFFCDIRRSDYVAFQSYAITEWQWSPSRMKRVKGAISSLAMYIMCVRCDEFPDFIPFTMGIKTPPRVLVREATVYSKTELDEILETLVNEERYELACALSLGMSSGRRKSELVEMKVSFFDEKNIIFGKLYRTPETIRTKGRGRAGKQLTVYVMKDMFKPYLDMWIKERERIGVETDWLFPIETEAGYADRHIEAETLDSWANTLDRYSKKHFYWHSLRHFFTTALSNKGYPQELTKDILGWESTDMVELYNDTPVEEKWRKFFEG